LISFFLKEEFLLNFSTMCYSKSLAFIGLALAAPTAAFAPSTTFSRPTSAISASPTPPDAIRNIAAVSALTLGLLFPSADALAAQDTAQLHALQSSTVEISTTITTMDFSMPSSYDSIADPLDTQGNKAELTQDTVVGNGSTKVAKKKAAPSKAKESTKEEAPAGLTKKEKSAAARAAKTAARLEKEAEEKAKTSLSAEEVQANIKEAREAKIAARKAAQAEEAAAAIAAEQK